jgi:glutamine amidotransferase-like uncharacterized protein
MRKKILKKKSIVFLLFLYIFMPITYNSRAVRGEIGRDLDGIRVGIYRNNLADQTLASRIAIQQMFMWMNATVENISAIEIKDGALSKYDIFVIPGRSEGTTYSELGEDGVNSILNYIRSGGNYFGICGGTNFAALNAVNLFSGTLHPVPGELRTPHILQMRVNTLINDPNLTDLNTSFSIAFWGSIYFSPDTDQQFITIASYSNSNTPGMIVYKFGLGTVFLSSPHAEFEENSDRDGTDEFDNFDDEDSEWDLLLRVAQWQVKVSKDNLIFIFIVSVNCGAFAIGAIVLMLHKRKHSLQRKKLEVKNANMWQYFKSYH